MKQLEWTSALRGFCLLAAKAGVVVFFAGALAMILMPNVHSRGKIARSSRSKADMRSTAMALSAYYVDHGAYPLSTIVGYSRFHVSNNLNADFVRTRAAVSIPLRDTGLARQRPTFAVAGTVSINGKRELEFAGLTTPVPYLLSYFEDTFSEEPYQAFAYLSDRTGFLMAATIPGAKRGELSALEREMRAQFILRAATPFDGRDVVQSRLLLQTGRNEMDSPGFPATLEAFVFDPTNGGESAGGIFRTSD